MSQRHNGDGAQPYIYHNPSHVYSGTLDATKHCNVNKNIPYTIDLATTQKTYILNNVFLNNIFLSPLPPFNTHNLAIQLYAKISSNFFVSLKSPCAFIFPTQETQKPLPRSTFL